MTGRISCFMRSARTNCKKCGARNAERGVWTAELGGLEPILAMLSRSAGGPSPVALGRHEVQENFRRQDRGQCAASRDGSRSAAVHGYVGSLGMAAPALTFEMLRASLPP